MTATIIRPDFGHPYEPGTRTYDPGPEPDEYDAVNIEPLPWPQAARRIFWACAALWAGLGFAIWRW